MRLLVVIALLSLAGCSRPQYSVKTIDDELVINGRIGREDIMKYKKFSAVYNSYSPKPEAIAKLRKASKDISVLIIAGSWCSDTERELPAFFKVADSIGLNTDKYDIFMVDRKHKSVFINTDALQIYHIPTFIIYRYGKEQGRIIEQSIGGIETNMLDILKIE